MADCHKLFQDYYNEIKLSESNKKKLRTGRDTLRKKIKKYFEDNKADELQPSFYGQGSYMMHTIIAPISDDEDRGEYDLDDGVYFSGKLEERKKTSTYHDWIKNAVDGHATEVVNKTTCVRVVYSTGYHIDLPIYFFAEEESHPKLAHTSKDWTVSDPKEFFDWFNEIAKRKPQLRKIVRYIKGWKDYRHSQNKKNELPSGMILTILAEKYYVNDERDDISLKETLKAMHDGLQLSFSCYRPTTPHDEDLLDNYSPTKKDYFLSQLKIFYDTASSAIEHPIQKDAGLKWQKHLGDRFSCVGACEDVEEANKYDKPFAIKSNSQSA